MSRVLALAIVMLLAAACQHTPARVEPAHKVVATPEPQRPKIPGWALQELPEEAPRERSAHEAVALSCRRLNIIRHANCLTKLLKRYNNGASIDPSACKLNVNQGCSP